MFHFNTLDMDWKCRWVDWEAAGCAFLIHPMQMGMELTIIDKVNYVRLGLLDGLDKYAKEGVGLLIRNEWIENMSPNLLVENDGYDKI